MTVITPPSPAGPTSGSDRIVVGVDTHTDLNVAAALDERGGLLQVHHFPATSIGYDDLQEWAE